MDLVLAPFIRFICLYLKREVMKRIKKIFRIKKETATATPKTEKAMLPKMEKRSK
jgi:hypothetical protein